MDGSSSTGFGVFGEGSTGVAGIGTGTGGLFISSGLILKGTNLANQLQFSVDSSGNVLAFGEVNALHGLRAQGNFEDTFLGDPGCGLGYSGIGFGVLSGCANYSMIGNGKDPYLNRPAGGYRHFRENNGEVTALSTRC